MICLKSHFMRYFFIILFRFSSHFCFVPSLLLLVSCCAVWRRGCSERVSSTLIARFPANGYSIFFLSFPLRKSGISSSKRFWAFRQIPFPYIARNYRPINWWPRVCCIRLNSKWCAFSVNSGWIVNQSNGWLPLGRTKMTVAPLELPVVLWNRHTCSPHASIESTHAMHERVSVAVNYERILLRVSFVSKRFIVFTESRRCNLWKQFEGLDCLLVSSSSLDWYFICAWIKSCVVYSIHQIVHKTRSIFDCGYSRTLRPPGNSFTMAATREKCSCR